MHILFLKGRTSKLTPKSVTSIHFNFSDFLLYFRIKKNTLDYFHYKAVSSRNLFSYEQTLQCSYVHIHNFNIVLYNNSNKFCFPTFRGMKHSKGTDLCFYCQKFICICSSHCTSQLCPSHRQA